MATLAAMRELDDLLDDVNRIAQRDLVTLWRAIQDRDPVFIRDALAQGVPEVVDVHARVAADLTATWYEELDPASAFNAIPAAPPPVEQVRESATWAANSLFRPGTSTPIDLAATVAQRLLFNTSRETVMQNAGRERIRWARVTRGDAKVCPFCRMLASRGYVYGSTAQARRVGSAGIRATYNYKGARQSVDTFQRGRMDRAVQPLGAKFHDHCRCRTVPNRGGAELPDTTSHYQQQYAEAVAATSDGGPIDLKKVLAHMAANP